MLPEYFAVIGAVIASLGGFYYLYETIKGTAKPNRITWLLWALLPAIIFVAQRVQGVQGISWATFVSGLTPALIFIASFLNEKAYWKTEPQDYACMALAIVGITLWVFTNSPNLAIVFAILADFFAGLPTFIKAAHHPETESWRAYAISATGFTVCLLAIHEWNIQNYAFVVYLVTAEGVLAILSGRKQSVRQEVLSK